MKKFIVYLFFLNLSCGLFAQNANYEQAEKAKSNRLPWNSDQLTPFFTQGSDDFWFREVKEGEEKYYYVDLKARKVEKLWDPVTWLLKWKKPREGNMIRRNLVFGKFISTREGKYSIGWTEMLYSNITGRLEN